MNDVRMPIETTIEGEKTTKVCVEDMYKAVNRVIDAYNKFVEYATEVFDEVDQVRVETELNGAWEGCLVVGRGISQPCHGDVYDHKIGEDIAFMKAKLNANIKKWNFFVKLWNRNLKLYNTLNTEIEKIGNNILLDLNGVRRYNPEYLKDIEYKLGL